MAAQEYEIRVMTEADYDEVYELWMSIHGFGIRSIDDSREGVARFLKRNPTTSMVAVAEGRIVGAILCGHDGRRGCFYHIDKSILERAEKAGNKNFLAYMYVFGYDNDAESINLIGRGEKEPEYFNKGIDIARRLGNVNLLLNAYMKNIILYSSYGFHRYVGEMYEKRIQLIYS